MFFSLLLASSLASAETPGFYVEPLLPNVEFAMVEPDDYTPGNGYVSVTNTGGAMLAIHNEYFPGPTQVVDGGSYTTVVYLDRLPTVLGWVKNPTTNLQIPILDGVFASVLSPCVGDKQPTVYIDVGGAKTVWLSATPLIYRKHVGLVGLKPNGDKELTSDGATDTQVAYDARTGVVVNVRLGFGILTEKMPSAPFVLRTSAGVVTYAAKRAFGDGPCLP